MGAGARARAGGEHGSLPGGPALWNPPSCDVAAIPSSPAGLLGAEEAARARARAVIPGPPHPPPRPPSSVRGRAALGRAQMPQCFDRCPRGGEVTPMRESAAGGGAADLADTEGALRHKGDARV